MAVVELHTSTAPHQMLTPPTLTVTSDLAGMELFEWNLYCTCNHGLHTTCTMEHHEDISCEW